MPLLSSSRWGSSALARDWYWRQSDPAPPKRRHETAKRTRTSREDGTCNRSCRYRPLKAIFFVSSLDAICGVNRNVRESLHTLNKQRFEKYFNLFRRTRPRPGRVRRARRASRERRRRARGDRKRVARRRLPSRRRSRASEDVAARSRAIEARKFPPLSSRPPRRARRVVSRRRRPRRRRREFLGIAKNRLPAIGYWAPENAGRGLAAGGARPARRQKIAAVRARGIARGANPKARGRSRAKDKGPIAKQCVGTREFGFASRARMRVRPPCARAVFGPPGEAPAIGSEWNGTGGK